MFFVLVPICLEITLILMLCLLTLFPPRNVKNVNGRRHVDKIGAHRDLYEYVL